MDNIIIVGTLMSERFFIVPTTIWQTKQLSGVKYSTDSVPESISFLGLSK